MAKTLSSKMKSMKQEQLKQKAEANTTVTKKVGRDAPTVVKQGVPLDHTTKHNPYENAQFGMSKGVTKNMENYESLRVDVWLTSEVLPGESIKEAYVRVEQIIDEVLEEAVLSTAGEC